MPRFTVPLAHEFGDDRPSAVRSLRGLLVEAESPTEAKDLALGILLALADETVESVKVDE